MVIKIDFPNAKFLLFYNSSILLSQKSIIANYFKTRLNKILCAISTRPFLNEISHTLRTKLIKNLKGQEPCPSKSRQRDSAFHALPSLSNTIHGNFRNIVENNSYLKIVCLSTSIVSAFNAFSTIFLLNAFSSSGFKEGLPSGCGIAIAGTIRLAPTVMEIGVTVHTCTTGIPVASIPLTIVAPQRVQVPHVLVRMTASTCAAFSLAPISSENFLAEATAVPLPTVV